MIKTAMKSISLAILLLSVCASATNAQNPAKKSISQKVLISIIQAEDELRFDETLKLLLKSPDASVRTRAALAAGRIGDESAVSVLAEMMLKEEPGVAQMAAFALGEIESSTAADALLKVLEDKDIPDNMKAGAIEAAGKIASANSDTDTASKLGLAILEVLQYENYRGAKQNRETILLGITAVLRAKPLDGDAVLGEFLSNLDGRIRSDAANAIARLGSSKFDKKMQSLLSADEDPIVRANAARVLGASKDNAVVGLLLKAALNDIDERVRVNAIGALGRVKDKDTANQLLERAESLMVVYAKSKQKIPAETNELLTISTAIGNIMILSGDEGAVKFLNNFRNAQDRRAPEVEVALIRVSPKLFLAEMPGGGIDWRRSGAIAQALGVAASLPESTETEPIKNHAKSALRTHIANVLANTVKADYSFPAFLSSYAEYKTEDLGLLLRESLRLEDVVVRETAAGLLGEQEPTSEVERLLDNYLVLREAFSKAGSDTLNDAALAALEGIKKQYLKLKDKYTGDIDLLEPVKTALNSPDYLVRKKAVSVAKEVGLDHQSAAIRVRFDEKGVSRVKRADYKRAAARQKASAVFTTAKGKFTIDFYPQDAPLTVENFINLAKSGYFNGLAIHRVVPNFVMQDGDPRGDGSGGPGWQIRCEINRIPFERGTVGMALSGKDTGGSQWFVAHSPQPHLDGGYTVFGKVNEKDMKIVDQLTRGDIIVRVEIID